MAKAKFYGENEDNRQTAATGNNPGSPASGASEAGKTGKEKIQGMVLVEDFIQEKPRIQTVDVPEVKAPKERKKKKDESGKKATEYKQMLDAFCSGCFAVAESKNALWKTSQEEINMITDPASRILTRLESLDNENMDYGLLIIGFLWITLPRLLVIIDSTKNTKKERSVKEDERSTKNTADTQQNNTGFESTNLFAGNASKLFKGLE